MLEVLTQANTQEFTIIITDIFINWKLITLDETQADTQDLDPPRPTKKL